MIMTSDNFQGMIVKGVAQEYDWTYLKAHLQEGGHSRVLGFGSKQFSACFPFRRRQALAEVGRPYVHVLCGR